MNEPRLVIVCMPSPIWCVMMCSVNLSNGDPTGVFAVNVGYWTFLPALIVHLSKTNKLVLTTATIVNMDNQRRRKRKISSSSADEIKNQSFGVVFHDHSFFKSDGCFGWAGSRTQFKDWVLTLTSWASVSTWTKLCERVGLL